MITIILPLALSISLLALIGCSRSNSDRPTERSEKPNIFDTSDEILETAQNIDSSNYISQCDIKFKEKRDILIHAILEKKAEILSYQSTLKPNANANYEVIQVGPNVFRKPLKPLKKISGWVTEKDNDWQTVWNDYVKIKENASDVDWVYLNSDVRSLLVNDENRTSGRVFLLNYDDEASTQSLLTSLISCKEDVSCIAPEFTERQKTYLLKSPYLVEKYHDLLQAVADKVKNSIALEKMIFEVQHDYNDVFKFRINAGVRRKGKTLELDVRPGVFADVIETIRPWIESVWNSEGLSLHLNTVAEGVENSFVLEFNDAVGSRAYTSWNSKKVVVYPLTRTQTLAHEFGHVLGFKDHYFTLWNEADCSYAMSSNDDDIMSNSATGGATTEEFNKLNEMYPASAQAAPSPSAVTTQP